MLRFDIDADEVARLAEEFEASERVLSMAFNRALRRTASTMKTQSRKLLRERLDLRSAAALRRRLRDFKLRRGSGRDLGSLVMWYGLNDLPLSAYKGRVRRTATGASKAGRDFAGAFVATGADGKLSIYRREGRRRFPIREVTVPIVDEAMVVLEDEVFDRLGDVFFKNLRSEIRARTIYGVE